MCKRLILLQVPLMALVLSACAQVSISIAQSTPTATSIPPSPTTAPTQVRPSILDVFPLRLGATYVYSVTVDYEENQTFGNWTGTVTETISGVAQQGDSIVFDTEFESLHPDLPSWLVAMDRYVARGNRIYQLSRWDNLDQFLNHGSGGSGWTPLIEWPLHVGQQWGEPQYLARKDGFYVWRVDAQEDIPTPAGMFDDCYQLMYLTNPDHTQAWFCPGFGIVRREYHHHGTRQDEVWELVKK